MDFWGVILVVGFIAGLLALIFAVVYLHGRVIDRLFAPIRRRRGLRRGRRGDRPDPESVEGKWNGVGCGIRYTAGGRHEPGRITYEMNHTLKVGEAVVFRRRNLAHRLAHRARLLHTVVSGDPRFDREVFVSSEDDSLIPAFIADESVRRLMMLLLRTPKATVQLGPDGVGATFYGRHFTLGFWLWRRLRPGFAGEVFESLYLLALAARHALSEGSARADKAASPPQSFRADGLNAGKRLTGSLGGKFLIFGCASMFAGPAMLFWGSRYPPVTWELYLTGLSIGVAALAAYLATAYFLLRGRSRSLHDFGVFAFAGAVGLPTFFAGALAVTNGFLDYGDPSVETAIVQRLDEDGRMHVLVERENGRPIWVKSRPASGEAITPGYRIEVRVRPGLLGAPWLERADSRTAGR